MKRRLQLFVIHQTTTSLQWTNNLNPRTRWYPALDESNRMKSTYFTIYPDKNPPHQNGCGLKSVFIYFKSTGFTSSTFPIQLAISPNQPVAITLNTGSPQTLFHRGISYRGRPLYKISIYSILVCGGRRQQRFLEIKSIRLIALPRNGVLEQMMRIVSCFLTVFPRNV